MTSEPYNKISDYLEATLINSLGMRGVKRLASIEGTCCSISLELLEVTTHPAVLKKPGMDATANLVIKDAHGRVLYSKAYRGEARTAMNTWRHEINHAIENMVANIVADDDLLKVLTGPNR